MPLVRIDVNQGRGPGAAPRRSAGASMTPSWPSTGYRSATISTSSPNTPAGQIFAQDAGLGFERTPDVVMIQIFTQGGRSQEAKQSLFAAIAGRLAELGVAGEDVFIGYVENTAGDWSFGFGQTLFVAGELAIPRK